MTEAGRYFVTVVGGNCLERADLVVENRVCPLLLEIPNVFIPNDDMYNNTFVPIIQQEVRSMLTVIYDRTARKVHETNDLQINWDGKLENGNDASDGVYYWII